MLKVFFTIDTEIWPRTNDWKETCLQEEMDFYIYGRTRSGDFGLNYQMDVLESNGLKGVFFVESLFAECIGMEPLERIVRMIADRGHDVQLHIHTEWLAKLGENNFIGKNGINMMDFSEDEQSIIIGKALDNLYKSAAKKICAFRAGNYGANFDTLSALNRNEILYDSSFNIAYHFSPRRVTNLVPTLHPKMVNSVLEIPVTFFEDWPRHFRHLQLTACSFNEIKQVLLHALEQRWYAVVLVSHSFELLKPYNKAKDCRANGLVIKRFEKLCRFLGANRDKFEGATFSKINSSTIPELNSQNHHRSRPWLTALRYAEQISTRIF